ncbi:hypothetical protein RND71_009909 [Anisodus tanguticus]|uniref:Uncharacterized protein n=1 Tax=Anisodus tanguticus TaxID=243964 RepID=A0AAE1VRN7_9SOLA|nr:hypothetical protein RND71_009909 [Anisodus tanguticus]
MEEHELTNSTVNVWKDIEQDKIDHMWDIILEKFDFDVSEERKGAILGHMSDIYRGYKHKLKKSISIQRQLVKFA